MTPTYTVDRGLIACLELSNCSEMLYKKTTSEHLYSKMETGTWVGTSMSFIEELRRKRRALLAATCFIGAVLTVSTHMPHMQVKQSAHVNLHFSTFEALEKWNTTFCCSSFVPLSLCCCTTSKWKYLGALPRAELTFSSCPHTKLQEQGMEGDTE